MRKIITYKCEYCGKVLKNKLDMERHEPLCKVATATAQNSERRITALLQQLHKNGFFVNVHWDGGNYKSVIVLYDPTHKYDR